MKITEDDVVSALYEPDEDDEKTEEKSEEKQD